MNEKDRLFIEELFVRQREEFQHFLTITVENFDHKLSLVAEGNQLLSEKMDRSAVVAERHQTLSEEMDRRHHMLSEEMDRRHHMLSEKMDRGHQLLSKKIEGVEAGLGLKIDKLVAEVAAHRTDTGAHHGVYRVRED